MGWGGEAGKISRIEWQQAMLTTLKVVDEGLLTVINSQFDHLNVDGDEFLSVRWQLDAKHISNPDFAPF